MIPRGVFAPKKKGHHSCRNHEIQMNVELYSPSAASLSLPLNSEHSDWDNCLPSLIKTSARVLGSCDGKCYFCKGFLYTVVIIQVFWNCQLFAFLFQFISLLLHYCWTAPELLLNCSWTAPELLLNCSWTDPKLILVLNSSWTTASEILLLSCSWTAPELLLNCSRTSHKLLLNCSWTPP